MKITYAPADDVERVFAFDPDKVRAAEAELVEKRFGDTFEKWRVAVVQGSARARRVLLWHLLRREHHTLRYEDVPDFAFGELKCEMTRRELAELRDKIAKGKHEERDAILAALDGEIESAPDGVDESAGKAS